MLSYVCIVAQPSFTILIVDRRSADSIDQPRRPFYRSTGYRLIPTPSPASRCRFAFR